MNSRRSTKNGTPRTRTGIAAITVCGYKSLFDEHVIEIRPLTILAGANSSGKSSAIQPLLLLKQTLEAGYDTGSPIFLDGPNVTFTSLNQFLSRPSRGQTKDGLRIGVTWRGGMHITLHFTRATRGGLEISAMDFSDQRSQYHLRPDMTHDEILGSFDSREKSFLQTW